MEPLSNKRIFSEISSDERIITHPSIRAFNNFISNRVSSNDNTFSHYSFATQKSYNVEKDQYDYFLELLSKASQYEDFEIIEYPLNIFPAVFCFQTNSLIVEPFLRLIVSVLFKHMKSVLKMNILPNYDRSIVVKETNNNGHVYIQFPFIVIFQRLFHIIREMVLDDKDLNESFNDFHYDCELKDFFCESISFPIVSCEDSYDLCFFNGLGETVQNTFFVNDSSRFSIVKQLSIRSTSLSEMVPLTVLGDVMLKSNDINIFNKSFICDIVELIHFQKVNSNDIAWALLNTSCDSDDLFSITRNLERHQWEYMKMNPSPAKSKLGLSTLIYFASVHSTASFKTIFFENIWLFIKNICDKYVQFYFEEKKKDDQHANEPILRAKYQSFDSVCYYMASIAKLMYGHVFVCSNISRKSWFFFNGVNWVKSNRAVHLSKLFESDFYSLFTYWSVKFLEEIVSNKLIFVKQTYSTCCSDFASFLRNPLKKKLLVDVCAEHFYWDFQHVLNTSIKSSNFDEILDTDVLLIGLQNGVYDLDSHKFRSSKPDDFVFLSTKNKYLEYDWNHPCVIEILDFLQHVFPNQRIRNYVLKLFASFIDGNIEEQFYIFTGTGSNGKSKIVELFQLAMGDYVATLPVSLITGKRTPSSSATPELARMRGKRLGVLHESNVTDTINLGLIKAISGGDNMYARALHSDPIEFRPTFQLLLLCNDKPKRIDPYDFATWRRIIVVTFTSSFLDDPDPNNPLHFQKDTKLHSKLPTWKEAFFWILTQHYEEFRNHGNPVPDEIIFDTKSYRESNDYIAIFINAQLKRTEFFNDVIYLDDVFCRFKTFFSHHYQEQSRMRFAEFSDIIVSKLGPIVTFNHHKKGWTHFIYV